MVTESSVDIAILNKCQSTIAVRNAIVHHEKRKVTHSEAQAAILGLEGVINYLAITNE